MSPAKLSMVVRRSVCLSLNKFKSIAMLGLTEADTFKFSSILIIVSRSGIFMHKNGWCDAKLDC